jgi:acyl-coenzyme A thioesterase PaaI-like protein
VGKRTGTITALNQSMPYAAVIGLENVEDEAGLLSVLRYKPSNIGNTQIPALHGGVVGAFLEHAAILHLLHAGEGEGDAFPKIVNISIDYLRPCRATDTFARGTLVKQGRRISNVRVEAWQDDPAKLVAAAHVHLLMP